MKLKLRFRRPSANNSTSFARLHPRTARLLHSEALSNVHSSSTEGTVSSSGGFEWRVQDEGDVAQFLPLLISGLGGGAIGATEPLYVSYNGGDCELENVIEVANDASILFQSDDEVDVKPLPQIDNARSIQMEPFSIADWELIEIYAQDLEAGKLLNQITVVHWKQVVGLRVGMDLVRLKVLQEGFQSAKLRDQSDIHEMEINPCLRLVSDTEVIIVPKLRSKREHFQQSKPLRLLPTENDYSLEMKDLFESQNDHNSSESTLIPSPPSFCASIHPETLSTLPGWSNSHNTEISSSSYERTVAVIRKKPQSIFNDLLGSDTKHLDDTVAVTKLLSSEIIPKSCIALHPNLRYQLSARPFQDCISVQLLSKEHIEREIHKLREMVEKREVQIRIVPLSLTTTANKDTIGMKHKSWRIPNDFRLSGFDEGHIRQDPSVTTTQSFLEIWRRMYLFSDTVFDGDAILTNGSIVSLPCGPDFASDFHYKILIKESNAKNKSLKTFLILAGQLANLSPLLDGDKVSTKSKYFDDYMLNILPGTRILTGNPVLSTAWQSKIDRMRVERKGESSCLAIVGETGCGKTHLCLSISAYLRKASYHCVYLDCKQLKSSQLALSDMLTELSSAFHEAGRCQPSLIILDDLDQLVPNIGVTNQRNDGSARLENQIDQILPNQIQVISDHLLFLIRSQKQILAASSGPLILCSCRSNKSLPADLRSADCFAYSIKCPSLNDVQRVDIFFSSMESLPSSGMKGSEEEHDVKYTLENVLNGTDSYRPKDMNMLGMRFHAIWAATRDAHDEKSPSEVLETLLSTFTPLSLRSLNIPPQKKNILEWKEIGGLFKAKTCLSDVILRPIKYNAVYKNVPITLPKGVLLFGPPGCGKSCLVPALAQACNFNIVTCHGPELLDKYIGASEAKVRQLFDNAYAAAPSILFFDDIDALAPKRGTDATGVTDRVVNQLLTFLDGVEMPENDSSTVYIIAASSRPDKIDPALLRPGRIERHFYIGLSENDKEFNDLLTKISLVRSVEEDTQIMIQDGTFLEKLTEAGIPYEKLTGADIKGIFDAAHIRAVHSLLQEERNNDIATAKEKDFRGHVSINEENLFRAFSSARPSISTNDLNTLSDSYLPFLGKEATSVLKRYNDKRHENPLATALKTMLK